MVRLVFTEWEKERKQEAENSFIEDKNEPYVESHFFRKARKYLYSFPFFCRESAEGGGAGGFCGPHAFLKGSLRTTFQPVEYQHDFKEQGVAQSARLRPMWPWFKSWRRYHM